MSLDRKILEAQDNVNLFQEISNHVMAISGLFFEIRDLLNPPELMEKGFRFEMSQEVLTSLEQKIQFIQARVQSIQKCLLKLKTIPESLLDRDQAISNLKAVGQYNSSVNTVLEDEKWITKSQPPGSIYQELRDVYALFIRSLKEIYSEAKNKKIPYPPVEDILK